MLNAAVHIRSFIPTYVGMHLRMNCLSVRNSKSKLGHKMIFDL